MDRNPAQRLAMNARDRKSSLIPTTLRLAGLALLVCLGVTQAVSAQSTLLAAEDVLNSGYGNSAPLGSPAQVAFDVHFRPDISCSGSLLGCQFRLPEGVSGTFDFYPSDALGFDRIASLLTDDVDDFIEFTFDFYQPDGTYVGGAGVGGYEEHEFGGLLTGASIDFFRLIVFDNTIDRPGDPSMCSPCAFSYRAQFRWEIWGHDS